MRQLLALLIFFSIFNNSPTTAASQYGSVPNGIWMRLNKYGDVEGWQFAPNWFCYISGSVCVRQPVSYRISGDEIQAIPDTRTSIHIFHMRPDGALAEESEGSDGVYILHKCPKREVQACFYIEKSKLKQ